MIQSYYLVPLNNKDTNKDTNKDSNKDINKTINKTNKYNRNRSKKNLETINEDNIYNYEILEIKNMEIIGKNKKNMCKELCCIL